MACGFHLFYFVLFCASHVDFPSPVYFASLPQQTCSRSVGQSVSRSVGACCVGLPFSGRRQVRRHAEGPRNEEDATGEHARWNGRHGRDGRDGRDGRRPSREQPPRGRAGPTLPRCEYMSRLRRLLRVALSRLKPS